MEWQQHGHLPKQAMSGPRPPNPWSHMKPTREKRQTQFKAGSHLLALRAPSCAHSQGSIPGPLHVPCHAAILMTLILTP